MLFFLNDFDPATRRLRETPDAQDKAALFRARVLLDRGVTPGPPKELFEKSSRLTHLTPRPGTIWAFFCRKRIKQFVMLGGENCCVLAPSRYNSSAAPEQKQVILQHEDTCRL
jgi:hypothetical protein